MLGVGPVQGSSFMNNSQVVGGAGLHKGLDQHQPCQLHPQSEQQVPGYSKMDDLMEMFASPVWPDINSMGRVPWDFNAGSSGSAMSMEAGSGLLGPQKMFTMSLLPSGLPGTSVGRQGLTSQVHEVQDAIGQPHSNESVHCPDSILIARLNHHRGLRDGLVGSTDGSNMVQSQIDGRVQALPHGMQEATLNALQRASEAAVAGSSRAPGLTRSASMGSSGSEISGCQQLSSDTQSPPSIATMWRKYYMGGVLIPPGGALNEAHLGKRPRDDEARAGPQESMFNTYGGARGQEVRSAGQQSHSQVSQGVSVPPYASHTGLGQPQGAAAVVAGTARPRVRARRGQATDPHSIAERLRRERIAERMKLLQELVPNSNKTDKASMLDEIIEYVRFLQLQVKVLSMSRLGGAGAVAPLVTDLPAEGHSNFIATAFGRSTSASGISQDSMAIHERHVARLMEDDMGTAMQFLQTKGLCLMPISLATAISSNNGRPATGSENGLTGRIDASSTTILTSTNAMSTGVGMPVGCVGDSVADEATTAGINGVRNSKEAVIQLNGVGSGQSSCVVNNGAKLNDEIAKTRSIGS